MQTTLRDPITRSGMTVFSGTETKVTLEPAPADHGIAFLVDGVHIPASVRYADAEVTGRTALKKEGARVGMIEHLLAALRGLQIDNILIRVEGNEIPMFDGSSLSWVDAIDEAGIAVLSCERRVRRLSKPVYWIGEMARCVAIPADELKVTYVWHAPQSKRFRSAFWEGVITPELFRSELQSARTFGFEAEVVQAQEAGLIRGASLERGLLIRDEMIVNEGGLRFEDEIVRHKALDIVGDLALASPNTPMHVIAIRSGHAGNLALAKAINSRLQQETTDESLFAKTDTRCEADCEDSTAPLSIFADR